MGIAGDSLSSVSYVPTSADTGPIGQVTIRRLAVLTFDWT